MRVIKALKFNLNKKIQHKNSFWHAKKQKSKQSLSDSPSPFFPILFFLKKTAHLPIPHPFLTSRNRTAPSSSQPLTPPSEFRKNKTLTPKTSLEKACFHLSPPALFRYSRHLITPNSLNSNQIKNYKTYPETNSFSSFSASPLSGTDFPGLLKNIRSFYLKTIQLYERRRPPIFAIF